MQRSGLTVPRSSGEVTLIGAIGALLILAAGALLLFEIAGFQDRESRASIAVTIQTPAADTVTDDPPASDVDQVIR